MFFGGARCPIAAGVASRRGTCLSTGVGAAALDSTGMSRRPGPRRSQVRRSAATTGQPRAEHFIYIVRCADGSLYTGYARDPYARVRVHNSGKGARFTAGRRPVRLVYMEECSTLSAALKREYAVKQLPRLEKQQLVTETRRRARSARKRRRGA